MRIVTARPTGCGKKHASVTLHWSLDSIIVSNRPARAGDRGSEITGSSRGTAMRWPLRRRKRSPEPTRRHRRRAAPAPKFAGQRSGWASLPIGAPSHRRSDLTASTDRRRLRRRWFIASETRRGPIAARPGTATRPRAVDDDRRAVGGALAAAAFSARRAPAVARGCCVRRRRRVRSRTSRVIVPMVPPGRLRRGEPPR